MLFPYPYITILTHIIRAISFIILNVKGIWDLKFYILLTVHHVMILGK